MPTDWKSVCLPPTASAETALQVLDAGGRRIALVTDESERLLGTVTDGDIRRALLRRDDLSRPVAEIMNAQPTTMRAGASPGAIRLTMERHGILHVPIVDESGRLVGLETLHTLMHTPLRDNWVLLMAGGFGTRLRPLTDDCPKPLLPVGGKPILESILESFIAAGFCRFCISVHYLGHRIKEHFGDGSRWGVTVCYADEEQPLGTAGALGLLPDVGGLPVVVMNGDVLTRLDFAALLDFHTGLDAAMTVCVREYDMQVPYGVVEGEDWRITGIVETPVHRFFVNTGIYVVGPEVIAGLKPVRRIDMPDLVNHMLADSGKVAMFPLHESWLDIGLPDDFERAWRESSR